MRLWRICLAVAILAVYAAATAQARILEIFPYQMLLNKSDLVVIGQPVTKTADTSEKTYFVHIRNGNDKIQAIGVETTFKVSLIIKGEVPSGSFILHHYRVANPQALGNVGVGPMTASFDPSDPRRRDVLFFLVKEEDGRYAPYGGQTDPNGNTVFQLDGVPRN